MTCRCLTRISAIGLLGCGCGGRVLAAVQSHGEGTVKTSEGGKASRVDVDV
jgi:hypothetical protein